MAIDDEAQLRLLLGETIPEDGTEADTMFTAKEIEHFLEISGGNMDRAAYEGWRAKAAQFANLVDTTEGNYARKFSQLMNSANAMAKQYFRSSGGSTEGRTRIGRIVRRDESDGAITT